MKRIESKTTYIGIVGQHYRNSGIPNLSITVYACTAYGTIVNMSLRFVYLPETRFVREAVEEIEKDMAIEVLLVDVPSNTVFPPTITESTWDEIKPLKKWGAI